MRQSYFTFLSASFGCHEFVVTFVFHFPLVHFVQKILSNERTSCQTSVLRQRKSRVPPTVTSVT